MSRLLRWEITSFISSIALHKNHQNGNTFSRFSVTEKGESRTVFDRETELINRIQLRNVPVATATKNDVLSHVVELTKNWLPSSQPDQNLSHTFD